MDNNDLYIYVIGLGMILIVLMVAIYDVRQHTKKYHKFALERELLAYFLKAHDAHGRQVMLDLLAETNPELYESWLNEPYPGPADYRWSGEISDES